MKKIVIGAPLRQTLAKNYGNLILFTILLIPVITATTLSNSMELPTSALLAFIGFSIILLLAIISTIINIHENRKYNVRVDDKGIQIKNGEDLTAIPWEEVTSLKMTFVIKKDWEDKNERTGYPFLFIKTSHNISAQDVEVKRFRYVIPFIKSKEYFQNYLGYEDNFDIAVNFENVKESESMYIIENYPVKVERIRPMIDVTSKEEYNRLISEQCSPEFYDEYKL